MKNAWILLLCSTFVMSADAKMNVGDPEGTGNDFLDVCSGLGDESRLKESWDLGVCAGYVDGVAIGTEISNGFNHKPPRICIPKEASRGQMYRVAIKYIRDHPEKSHAPSAALIFESFIEAFPCKGTK